LGTLPHAWFTKLLKTGWFYQFVENESVGIKKIQNLIDFENNKIKKPSSKPEKAGRLVGETVRPVFIHQILIFEF
jgi:hypothetical protein